MLRSRPLAALLLALMLTGPVIFLLSAEPAATAAENASTFRWLGGGDISDVFFLGDGRHGWAVGDNGTILRTRDGGATWLADPSGTTANLTRIDMADAFNGWVIGDGGLILGRHLIPPPPATSTPTPTPTITATNTSMPTGTPTPTATSPVAYIYLPLVQK